ncbi:uncharacterized protein CcaverHIS019_0113160 [Cutaneotrichosporon cavernicola]|uniref:galacturonan 1,4-alpha-galacturonidase n=1 Tax=Cutaneotrichosporon cavernicola TaxID=279322 RepID=A0AA48L2E0_9TREE|nr:uncharacterized protein CcaverHIS019_0113160 [Cutaneotrichosporon cavernicola]BEI88598.1 hypothetical protein CcaverHIS019_0113160 [Cutaneotrichosporon cavernicola]BEI96371.1 hypothetical protein CcaverHIS631_0113200 [Cutaneotrichosporon cavernicola]BEJ04143.1 hypothetical protein CcaverHIS641_0113180 [Cutaneotrichosporon cavernicola]
MRFLALLAVLATLGLAQPVTPTPRGAEHARPTCVVEHADGGDDTPNVHKAVEACRSGGVIHFASGVDYQILTPVQMQNLTDVEIRVEGNLHLPQDMEVVRTKVAADAGLMLTGMRWFSFGGKNVRYVGTTNVTGGWIEGYGQQYWDANPANGTGIDNRPKLIMWELEDSSITHLKIRKPPAWVSSISGNNIDVRDVYIDASTRPGGGFPFNTDGFDVAATNIQFHDMTILNGDDAIAIQAGAENVLVENVYAGGPGCHGMSIGSLGRDNTQWVSVKNIHFKDITMVGAVYAARFKSYEGGQGLVENITWENFKIENVTIPIYVTQTYHNQGSLQTQNGQEVKTNVTGQAVQMQNFTWKNWRGSINTFHPGDASCASTPCWYDVPGATGSEAVIMTCANADSCRGFNVENVQVIPQDYSDPSIMCTNVGTASNPEFGIDCVNGTFVPRP